MKKSLIALSLVFFAGSLCAQEAEVDVANSEEAVAEKVELTPAEESARQALIEDLEAVSKKEELVEVYEKLADFYQETANNHREIIDRLKEVSGQEHLVIPFNVIIK